MSLHDFRKIIDFKRCIFRELRKSSNFASNCARFLTFYVTVNGSQVNLTELFQSGHAFNQTTSSTHLLSGKYCVNVKDLRGLEFLQFK